MRPAFAMQPSGPLDPLAVQTAGRGAGNGGADPLPLARGLLRAGDEMPNTHFIPARLLIKVFDKTVKSFVFSCTGGPACKMQLPKDDKKLSERPTLCMQNGGNYVGGNILPERNRIKDLNPSLPSPPPPPVVLLQPYLVLQVQVPPGQPFSIELMCASLSFSSLVWLRRPASTSCPCPRAAR